MKRFKRSIWLMLCLLVCCLGYGQAQKTVRFEVNCNADGVWEASFSMDWDGATRVDDEWLAIDVEGLDVLDGAEGAPQLPCLHRLLTLPATSRLTLETWEGGETSLAELRSPLSTPLAPMPAVRGKNSPVPMPVPDKKLYATDNYYRGGPVATLTYLGCMRDQAVYRLTLRPFAYNPVSGDIRYYTDIQLRMSVEEAHVSSLPTALPGAPRRYAVVAREEFRQGLQPFLQWKRQEGYEMVELYSSTHRRDSVKALLQPLFDDATPLVPAPEYILLVGDAAQLQSFIGEVTIAGLDDHVTDLYYADFTGDYLPDALLGRWPVNDTAELGAVVRKTLAYEQGLQLDDARLQRALVVAGQEARDPAPITTNGHVNYVSRTLKEAYPAIDTVCYRNPASGTQRPQVLADLSRGASLVSYTAHCNISGWQMPSVSFSQIDTMTNRQPMLFVNNCCLSNRFDGTCFGEQLLRKATGGAIGVVGATNETLWNEDYYWAVGPKYPFSYQPVSDPLRPGAFDLLTAHPATPATAGALMMGGNLAVSASGSPYDHFYWEIYCLLGDPSLRPYIGTPADGYLYAPDTFDVGATSVRVSGRPGTTVSALQGGELLGSVTMGDQRSTRLDFCRPADTLPILFTATAPLSRPAYVTSYPRRPEGVALIIRNLVVTDTAIHFQLANVGTIATDSLWAKWRCGCEDDTLPCATTAPQRQLVVSLAPRQTCSVHMPVSVVAFGPMWTGTLTVVDGHDVLMTDELTLRHWIADGGTTVATLLDAADGRPALTLDAGQPYTLRTVVSGVADSLHLQVEALPFGESLADSGVATPQSPIATPLLTPDSLTHLHISGHWQHGNVHETFDRYLVAGERMESFEEGFASYPWQQGNGQPWTLDSLTHHGGRFSARSGAIDYRQTSDLLLTLFLTHPDSLSFWAAVSSQENCDMLQFSIDDTVLLRLSGWPEWRRYAYLLGTGRHTLRWRYIKDEYRSERSDCAWIDDLQLPLAIWDSAYGYFGPIESGSTLAVPAPVVQEASLILQPNPACSQVWLSSSVAMEVTLFSMTGLPCIALTLTPGVPCRLDTSFLPRGTYLVAGRHHGGMVCQKLVIINN